MDEEQTAVAESQQLVEFERLQLSPEQVIKCCTQPTDGGKIAELPSEVFQGVIFCLVFDAWSDRRVSDWLEEKGHSISKNTVNRYRLEHIEPIVGTRKQLVANREWFNDLKLAIDLTRTRETLAEFQLRRVAVLGMKESGVTSVDEMGKDPDAFEHIPFLYKDVQCLSQLLDKVEEGRRVEGGLSDPVAAASDDDVVVVEETTTRKLSMASRGRLWRVLEGLEPIEAITGGKPPDIVVTEVNSEEEDGRADGDSEAGAAGAAAAAETTE